VTVGWRKAELQTVTTTFADGDWIETKDQSDSGIRLIQTGNVGDGVFKDRAEKARFISEETFKRIRCTEIRPGDCLISRLPDPVGRACIIPETGERMITAVDCTILRFDRSAMDPEFFVYFAQSRDYLSEIAARSTGTTRLRISRANLGNVTIPLPTLNEQKRIVAVLDEAFEGLSRARANAKANLADAQVLALNHLRNLFAECERLHSLRRIGDIAEHCLGKMLDKNKNQGALRPYLRNINVRWFEVDTSDMLEMRIEDREVDRYSAKKGDLLICEGGYPGRAAVWDKDEPVFFQKALHRVRFSNPAYATFLMYFLFMKDATEQLKEHFTGSGIQHFTGQALAQFQMPFPDLGAVGKTVSQIEEVNATTSALERHYQATISQLDALRQALLQKAFSGELT